MMTDYNVIYVENAPTIMMMFFTVFTVLTWLMVSFTNMLVGNVTVFTIAITYIVFLLFTFIGYIIKYVAPSAPGAIIDLGDPEQMWLNVGLGALVGLLIAVAFVVSVKNAYAPVVTTAILLVLVCIAEPIVEETFFRGWILPTLAGKSPLFSIIVTNAGFAAYHMGTWGSIGIIGYFVPFAVGVVLSVLTLRLKSIAPAIICHMALNTVINLGGSMIVAITLLRVVL
jgi:membrane protease YdiL (CAAX protease family)